MAWIKRNVFFVVSMVAGLILTGYCVYLFWNDLGANSDANTEFQSKASDYNALQGKSPYPSEENIKLARADQERIQRFLNDFRNVFPPFPTPPREDQQGFNSYLVQTISELTQEANDASVQLPDGFSFAFTEQKSKLNNPPENIQPWMEQLQEIRGICRVLFAAKINKLESLYRVRVTPDDTGFELIDARTSTNLMQITTPYKVSFRGFSPEIAAVLEGFARSRNCFIVKSIDVRPSTYFVPAPVIPMAPAPPPTRNSAPGRSPGGGDIRHQRMLEERMRGAPGNAPVLAEAGPASATPVTVLSERPLYVTLALEVVKFKPADH